MTTATQTMTAEELVAEIERIDAELYAIKQNAGYWQARKRDLTAQLARALSPETGEVVIAPSGRRVFSEWGPDGDAQVNVAAIEEHHYQLPDGLRPRYETRYPSVGEIRKAAKDGQLPKAVSADDLLIAPRKVAKVRWRTPEVDER